MAYTGNKPTNVVDVSETQSLTVDGDLTVDTNTLNVNSTNNNVGIRTTSQNDFYSKELVIAHADEGGITLFGDATTGTGYLMWADGTTGNEAYRGYIGYSHSTPDVMVFGTSGSGRMRIDSAGQVIIGKTSASTSNAGLHIAGNETADGSPAYIYSVKTYSGTRNVFLNYHSGTYVGGINMTNTATSFPTSSDERLKKNIVDAPSAGDKIDAMQVRSFNWKADDSFQEYGLIAQELQSVYDLPVEHHDTEDTYTVDYSKLIPVLLKEIQDLRKRVATLENS